MRRWNGAHPSDSVASCRINAAADAFGEADVLVAAARFTQMHECKVPRIVSQATVQFIDGCYIPLALLGLDERVIANAYEAMQ